MSNNLKHFFTINARVTAQLNSEFDEWRRRQRPQIPSRSDALRELLRRGMRAKQPRGPTACKRASQQTEATPAATPSEFATA